jgi:hypothetical protein
MDKTILLAKKTNNLVINNDIQKYYLTGHINKFTYLQHLNVIGSVNSKNDYFIITRQTKEFL